MEAVAALWEQPETEVEAVHLAIALAYHGLLRQPSRSETSDMTPRKASPHLLDGYSIMGSLVASKWRPCSKPLHDNLALCSPVCQDGRQGGSAVRLLYLPQC